MKTFYKELQDRLKYLELQEQTEEIIGRINELTLVIVKVQQLLLENISNKSDYCNCPNPIDQSNGTGRCVTCNKLLGLIHREQPYLLNKN